MLDPTDLFYQIRPRSIQRRRGTPVKKSNHIFWIFPDTEGKYPSLIYQKLLKLVEKTRVDALVEHPTLTMHLRTVGQER